MHWLFYIVATGIYRFIIKPLMFKYTQPDYAHEKMIEFGSWAGKHNFLIGLLKFTTKYQNPRLKTTIFGKELQNPIGFAAGIDKNAEIYRCIEACGFSLATYGSMTWEVTKGNPRPWFHRLPQYQSMMIHVGLANYGVKQNIENLMKAYDETQSDGKNQLVGCSVARTNMPDASVDVEAGIKDYISSIKFLVKNQAVNYIEINISCPNAFCGEQFTEPKNLDLLLTESDKIKRDIPVFLKMPSDKEFPEFKKLIDVALKHNVQAFTISNLRKNRDGLEIPKDWRGNLSGKPLQNLSDDLVKQTYNYLQQPKQQKILKDANNELRIIGLGGVFSGQDAYQKIRSGANIVEIASALMFKGPTVVAKINRELVKLLKKDGFTSVAQAVGVDANIVK